MYSILKLIIILEVYAYMHLACKAKVLGTTQQDENDLSGKDSPELGVTNAFQHIDNRIKPAEIRQPISLDEIINYVGADKFRKTDAATSSKEGNQAILNYKELANLLAFWQWAKEQNFYETHTNQPDINNNYVTFD